MERLGHFALVRGMTSGVKRSSVKEIFEAAAGRVEIVKVYSSRKLDLKNLCLKIACNYKVYVLYNKLSYFASGQSDSKWRIVPKGFD